MSHYPCASSRPRWEATQGRGRNWAEPEPRKCICSLKQTLPGVCHVYPEVGSGTISTPQVFSEVVGQGSQHAKTAVVSNERGMQVLARPALSRARAVL